MTSKHRFELLLIAATACSDLTTIEPLVCGNHVTEVRVDEDCDGEIGCGAPETPGACRYVCANHTCPAGYGCGVDGICRQPSGSFVVRIDERGVTMNAATGDLDGDGRDDLVRITGDQLDFEFFDHTLSSVRHLVVDRPPADVAPLVAELTYDDNGAGDGRLDVAFAADTGLQFGSGLSVFRSAEDHTLTPPAYPRITLAVDDLRVIPIRALRPLLRDEVLLFATVDQRTVLFAMAADLRPIPITLGVTLPSKLDALHWVTADVDRSTACEDLLFGYGSRLHLFSPCVVEEDLVFNVTGAGLRSWDTPAPIDDLLLHDGAVYVTSTEAPYLFRFDPDRSAFEPIAVPPPVSCQEDDVLATGHILALADINRDGTIDLLTDDAVYISSSSTAYETAEDCLDWSEASVGDIDGNGHDDIVAARIGEPDLEVAYGAGDGAFTWRNVITSETVRFAKLGDFDGDGIHDVVFVEGEHEVRVAYGDGSGGVSRPRLVGTLEGPSHLAVGRVEGNDAAEDVVVAFGSGAPNGLAILSGRGSRQLVSPFGFDVATEAERIRTAVVDLALSSFTGSQRTLAVLTVDEDDAGAGSRLWAASVRGASNLEVIGWVELDCEGCSIVPIDLDDDATDEVVVLGDEELFVYERGEGDMLRLRDTVEVEGHCFASDGFLEARVVDMDRDGIQDVVALANRAERCVEDEPREVALVVFFGAEDGRLSADRMSRLPLPEGAAFTTMDVAPEAGIELIVAHSGAIDVIEVRDDRSLVPLRTIDVALPFEPEFIVAADFDGDGVHDLAATAFAGYVVMKGVAVR